MPLNFDQLPDFLEHIKPSAVRVRGHRVSLEHIVDAFEAGYTAESIATFFPTIKLATIYAVIAFYLANQEDVRAYVEEGERDFEAFMKAHPSKGPTLEELRRRMVAKQAKLAEAEKTIPF